MVNVPMKSSAPLSKNTIASINQSLVQGARSSKDILSLNRDKHSNMSHQQSSQHTIAHALPSAPSQSISPSFSTNNAIISKPIPSLLHHIQKGQKVSLTTTGQLPKLKCSLGWNTTANCDIDVSAFLLNSSGKVIGDTWFVFYGQTTSPDGSTVFNPYENDDRESLSIDLTKINTSVSKIVFVLTINEAKEKELNFSMVSDTYIRILNSSNNQELVSFMTNEYYSNVTSMMIGEIYLHNNTWKFNAIGNGVAKDLAGLCELYGVMVI